MSTTTDREALTADAAARELRLFKATAAQKDAEVRTELAAFRTSLADRDRAIDAKIQAVARAKAPDETVEWFTVDDPDVAAAELSLLHGWVRAVWRHHAKPPACWMYHPLVVEELRALRMTWLEAYNTPSRPTLMTTWQGPLRKAAKEGALKVVECKATHLLDVDDIDGAGFRVQWRGDPEDTIRAIALWWVESKATDEYGIPPGLVPA